MRSLFLAASLTACSLYANHDLEQQVSLLECKMKAARDDTVYPCRAGARFASGRPFYCGYGIWATGEVLYWTAFEGGTDYAYTSTSSVFENEIGTVHKAKFDWDVGYRIGLSYSWPKDNWDLGLFLTQFNPEAENSVQAPAGGRIGSLFLTGEVTLATDADIHWKTKLSTLDLELGREYFVSRYLFLRPHFGARAAWVHQKAKADFTNSTLRETIHGRSDFTGGGLRLGGDSKWFLDRHWNLNLNGSVSALYGQFKVSDHRTLTTSGVLSFSNDMAEDIYRIVPAAQMVLGLGWETFFSDDGNHLSLNVGYEVNYWWRQNQMTFGETINSSPYGSRYSDDLGFHGVTFDMQVSF